VSDPPAAPAPTAVVAEDEVVTRVGFVHLLRTGGIDVVAEAADKGELLANVDRFRPDVVVTDVRMPPTRTTEGIDAAVDIRQRHPGTAVLVVSQVIDPVAVIPLLEHHHRVGYLLKERITDPSALVDAVRRVVAGDYVVDAAVVSALVQRRRRVDPLESLSEREREVLSLVAEGLSNAAIGRRLFISARTVEVHCAQVFGKLGLGEESGDTNRRVLAVLAFLRKN
jgi:serine/threonine-protein kinase